MAEQPASVLAPPPERGGRVFTAGREVRFGDVDRRGHLRLDALAAYLQDVAGDDTADAGLRDTGGWLVRRTLFEVVRPIGYAQPVTLSTWASGAGHRWAERRLTVTDPAGGRVESVSLWVYVDPDTLRPAPLHPSFDDVYAPATAGRRVSTRLQHAPAPDPERPVERHPWALRATDADPFGHVNNAATWAVVEEALDAHPVPAPFRAELEYRTAIPPDAQVAVERQVAPGQVALWIRSAADGTLFATARVTARPG